MTVLPWDWQKITDEALDLLQKLIRIDTTNPPGNETPAIKCLAAYLEENGLSSTIFESKTKRSNLICRLSSDGSLGGPLLLNAHVDVVPAKKEAWEHPPFGGEIHEGYLWGRGAIDMKHMAAMSAVVMAQLHKSNLLLSRDIIFAAVADEEAGCEHGSRFLVENHPEQVQAEYVLGEVGGFTLHFGDQRFYPVQIAEKGIAWLEMKAYGTPGHGSIPRKDNAVVKLSKALQKIGSQRLPQHNTPVVKNFLEKLAALQPVPLRLAIPLLLRPELSGLILSSLFPDQGLADTFSASLSNTATPTMLFAGEKINVIPDVATAKLDGRTLPGQTEEDLIQELKQLVGDEFDFEVLQSAPPVENPEDPKVFQAIQEVLDIHDPGSIAIPYLIPGFTDAKSYRRLGAKCYGFSPIKLPKGLRFSEMYHGHNERIPVEGFRWGTRVLFALVKKLSVRA